MNSVQWKMSSPVGALYIVADPHALKGVFWKKQPAQMVATFDIAVPAHKIIAKTVQQLSEYFAGLRQEFSLPLGADGTAFQKRVWQELSQIPYGKTHSYSEIAKRLQNEGAVRAVGTANGRNPLSIIVPCHRVIAADGTLGGYAGGLTAKAKLLELEQKGAQP